MQPKISIIIPVYNVEPYLSRCIDSVLNQSFSNFELILINDGSTDKSGDICDEYATKDSRLTVIHQGNKGVSDARNRGLDIAKGEYIGFVDPDDYIDYNMYQILFELIEEYTADISFCGYKRISELDSHEYLSATTNTISIYNKNQTLENYFSRKKPFSDTFLWNNLFRKDLFNNVRVNEKLTIQEDREVLLRIFNQSNKIVYIDTPFYNYIIRDTGASRNKNLRYYHSLFETMKEIYSYTLENIPNYSEVAMQNYIECIFNTFVVLIERSYPKTEYVELRQEVIRLFSDISKNRKLSLKYKLHTIFIIISPLVYSVYIKLRLKRLG